MVDLPPGIMKGDVNWARVFARHRDEWLKERLVRDPARIDPIIEELRAYWKAHPDMRLGQIISNAASDANPRKNLEWGVNQRPPFDPFYVEDDEIHEGIRNLP